jgi:hypothetical protein
MNEMLRGDVTGFEQAAPTLRSAQVIAACQAYRSEDVASSRRAFRPAPAVAIVEARPRVASPRTLIDRRGSSAPPASVVPPPPGPTLLATMAREVTAAVVLGLLGVARRAATR